MLCRPRRHQGSRPRSRQPHRRRHSNDAPNRDAATATPPQQLRRHGSYPWIETGLRCHLKVAAALPPQCRLQHCFHSPRSEHSMLRGSDHLGSARHDTSPTWSYCTGDVFFLARYVFFLAAAASLSCRASGVSTRDHLAVCMTFSSTPLPLHLVKASLIISLPGIQRM